MTDMLVNRCRSFIFTTALAPASAAAALAALEVLRSAEGERLLGRLAATSARLRPGRPWHSPIVPFVLGEEQAALAPPRRSWPSGLLVPAVRPRPCRRGHPGSGWRCRPPTPTMRLASCWLPSKH